MTGSGGWPLPRMTGSGGWPLPWLVAVGVTAWQVLDGAEGERNRRCGQTIDVSLDLIMGCGLAQFEMVSRCDLFWRHCQTKQPEVIRSKFLLMHTKSEFPAMKKLAS